MTENNGDYGARNIQVLEGLEPVRKRPGMYIGSTDETGLHHLIWEIVDNSIDEAMAGYCDTITVRLGADGSCQVEDNGRGIPVATHPKTGKSTLETILTVLHAGGKFGGGGYKVSGGLHGVGSSVVNALSTRMEATVYRDGKAYFLAFEKGMTIGDIEVIGTSTHTGTMIKFWPDPEIFKLTTEFNYQTILKRLRQQAYLTKGITLIIYDDRVGSRYKFYFEGGVKSYVNFLNVGKDLLGDIFYFEEEKNDILVEISMQYNKEYDDNIITFVNNIHTPDGGSHLTGFRTALTRTINKYARDNNILKEKDKNLTNEDVVEGLTRVLSIKVVDPQFEGQTKSKLGTPEARGVVDSTLSLRLGEFLEENPTTAKVIIDKVFLRAKARMARRARRDTIIRKGALEGMTLPGKLADCSSRKPENSELYIVEGDSAGGSRKQGRDRNTQAILPLRGKILNTQQARVDRVFASEEIKNLIIALGTSIGDTFDISKLRYHRIVIMTDADVDGAHIRTLLLTFFFRYLRDVIKGGYLYIAQPPLYKLSKGKQSWYVYSDAERDKIIKEYSITGENIQRYKGLGEMNPDQLWETTMDPEHRKMLRVKISDAEEASETFNMLMGSDVLPRRRFIQSNAKAVKNLDI